MFGALAAINSQRSEGSPVEMVDAQGLAMFGIVMLYFVVVVFITSRGYMPD